MARQRRSGVSPSGRKLNAGVHPAQRGIRDGRIVQADEDQRLASQPHAMDPWKKPVPELAAGGGIVTPRAHEQILACFMAFHVDARYRR
jgi:hypothetical protein